MAAIPFADFATWRLLSATPWPKWQLSTTGSIRSSRGRTQSPAIHSADVIKQDEFTDDVLVPLPGDRWLVYGTT